MYTDFLKAFRVANNDKKEKKIKNNSKTMIADCSRYELKWYGKCKV